MANVLNKTTFEYRISVHEPSFPKNEWWWDPILPPCDFKYMKRDIENDIPVEMTAAEKAVVDAQIESEKRYNMKSKNQIMTELWIQMTPMPEDSPEVVQQKTERQTRWINAIAHPLFTILSLHLDNNDYTLARERCQQILGLGLIIQEDYNIFDSILPLVRI